MRVGRNGGEGVPRQPVIALMSPGSWLLLFAPPGIKTKFKCVIYLMAEKKQQFWRLQP